MKFRFGIANYKIKAKQNKITLIIILQFDFLLKTCKPSMWDPSKCAQYTDISDLTFKICWNEKLRKMRYVPDIGEPKQAIRIKGWINFWKFELMLSGTFPFLKNMNNVSMLNVDVFFTILFFQQILWKSKVSFLFLSFIGILPRQIFKICTIIIGTSPKNLAKITKIRFL